MKIAYLVNTYPRASHTFIRREIRALERQGVTIHRLAMRSDRAQLTEPEDLAEDDLTEHVLDDGLSSVLLRGLRHVLSHPAVGWRALRLAWQMGRLGRSGPEGTGGVLRHLVYLAEAAHVAAACRAREITHVHAHFGTNSAAVASLCAALGGPGFSFTVHGPEEFDAPRALALAEKIAACRFVVAISSFGRSQLCRWVPPADWARIRVVHCGIDPARFAECAEMPPGPGLRLVAIGRLAPQKGFDLLIEAVARLAPRLPELNVTLVGDGPLRPRLESAIRDRGIEANLTLAGWQDEAGVRAALAKAHGLILPSFAEGLPVVLMEAFAAARPVIATAIAGVPELVSPRTGWLVPAGDAGALAEAIEEMAQIARDEPARLAEIGLAARQRVLERHDIDREAARLAEHFREFQ